MFLITSKDYKFCLILLLEKLLRIKLERPWELTDIQQTHIAWGKVVGNSAIVYTWLMAICIIFHIHSPTDALIGTIYIHIHTHTHWSVKQINKMHVLCVFHIHSLKHGNLELKEQFQAVSQLPGCSPSFQQYWETKKITTKQVYRMWLLPPLFVNTSKHLLTEFCLSCILISKAACLGLLIAWGLERFPRAWGENCPPGIKEGWSL